MLTRDKSCEINGTPEDDDNEEEFAERDETEVSGVWLANWLPGLVDW